MKDFGKKYEPDSAEYTARKQALASGVFRSCYSTPPFTAPPQNRPKLGLMKAYGLSRHYLGKGGKIGSRAGLGGVSAIT